MKNYPTPFKRVFDLDTKSVIVEVPIEPVLNIAVEYQKAHQSALGGHKITLAEICSLIIFQGLEKTKEQIEGFKANK